MYACVLARVFLRLYGVRICLCARVPCVYRGGQQGGFPAERSAEPHEAEGGREGERERERRRAAPALTALPLQSRITRRSRARCACAANGQDSPA